jgi:hypothetical protein
VRVDVVVTGQRVVAGRLRHCAVVPNPSIVDNDGPGDQRL